MTNLEKRLDSIEPHYFKKHALAYGWWPDREMRLMLQTQYLSLFEAIHKVALERGLDPEALQDDIEQQYKNEIDKLVRGEK